MNYQEAIEHSLKVKWKTSLCTQGEKCWCRIIEPSVTIKDSNDEEIYIVGSGGIPKEYAEHIVKIHNESIKN